MRNPIAAVLRAALVLVLALLSACAAKPKITAPIPRTLAQFGQLPPDIHVPLFARKPYEPFSRADAVAMAMDEWRLWGQNVDDLPPGERPPNPPELKPERYPGLWERVGEYWWLGQDANRFESAWTGKHDEFGNLFPATDDGNFAWSAAFISYIMREAGAGNRFVYSPTHSDYINAARDGFGVLRAHRPSEYAPQPGDLICHGRGRAAHITFDDLPTSHAFPSHCDIVVQVTPGTLSVIGGNVDDEVTMKHVPVTPQGMLAAPDGHVLDTRYPWFVVIQILYDR